MYFLLGNNLFHTFRDLQMSLTELEITCNQGFDYKS